MHFDQPLEHFEPIIVPFDGIGRDPATLIGKYIQLLKADQRELYPLDGRIVDRFTRSLYSCGYDDDFFVFRIFGEQRLRYHKSDELLSIAAPGKRKVSPSGAAYMVTINPRMKLHIDMDLVRALQAVEVDRERMNGIRVEDAVVGMATSASWTLAGEEHIQVHRVVGLKLEGMETLSWIICYRLNYGDGWVAPAGWYDLVLEGDGRYEQQPASTE